MMQDDHDDATQLSLRVTQDDSTQLSSRVAADQTKLSSRGSHSAVAGESETVDDATVLSSRAGSGEGNVEDDATRLSGRVSPDDATMLSSRAVADQTVLSSRSHDPEPTLMRALGEDLSAEGWAGLGAGMHVPPSEIGVNAVVVAYDPHTDGIVATSYEPRVVQTSWVVQPTPDNLEFAPQTNYGALEAQVEDERRYQRGTARLMLATAGVGLLVFGGSIAALVLLAQGF